jgi:hypothetical protein
MILETGHWQASVMAALSTYSGRRFQSGKDLQVALNGFWTLIDNASPAEVEPNITRVVDYKITPTGELVPSIEDVHHLKKSHKRMGGEDLAAADQDREAKRLRRQMRKMAASYVFSNLDCKQFTNVHLFIASS